MDRSIMVDRSTADLKTAVAEAFDDSSLRGQPPLATVNSPPTADHCRTFASDRLAPAVCVWRLSDS